MNELEPKRQVKPPSYLEYQLIILLGYLIILFNLPDLTWFETLGIGIGVAAVDFASYYQGKAAERKNHE